MKVLVACEESQAVTKEFRALGHEAYSCDILDCSGGCPQWHIKNDVLSVLNGNCQFVTMDGQWHLVSKWDMIIAFPPCTYLTNAGTRQFSLKCNSVEKVAQRTDKRLHAAEFFMKIVNADCKKIAIENPVGYMNSAYRKPDQIIQPYFFADSIYDCDNYVQKRTCLWLKGLPRLKYSDSIPKPQPLKIRQCNDGQIKKITWCESVSCKGGQAERARIRSKTFPGVAHAMAIQWA